MSRIPAVTRSLAQHILTRQWDPRLPRSFEITTERLQRARARAHWLDESDDLKGLDVVAEKD